MTVKINSDKDTELHHRNAVNQNLRAGQRVRITPNAKNKDVHWEIGEFVKYTDVYVDIDGEEHWTSVNSLEVGAKDPQRLERGDKIEVKDNLGKKVARGKTGRFDRYADVRVDIDGSYHRFVVNSVERV